MKKDLILLTSSEVLFSIAESAIVVFGMIFFYQKFNSILLAASPFILLHLLYAFLLPFFRKVFYKIGLKRSIMIGSLFYISSAVLIYATNGKYTFEVLCLWALLYALGNVFHYTPIIYILGSETEHKSRGKTFGLRRMVFITAAIVTPVLGGLISQNYGFQGLLIACVAFHLLTNIPITKLSIVEMKMPKPILETLTTMRGKRIFLYNIANIFGGSINDFWPIYVFIILAGSFSSVGILFSLVSLVSIILTYFISRLLDKKDRTKLFGIANATNLVTWIFKALSFNYITVLLADIAFRLNGEFKGNIIEVVYYDILNDHAGDTRSSIIIFSETIVNYMIAFVFFAGAMSITIIGFQASFIIFAVLGFVFSFLMIKFLKK